jgi:hypothetical protein
MQASLLPTRQASVPDERLPEKGIALRQMSRYPTNHDFAANNFRQLKHPALPAGILSDTAPGSKQ